MTVRHFPDLIQGSAEWVDARRGLLTASEMRLIVSIPKDETRIKKNGDPYKQRERSPADNERVRAHIYELAAQRITVYVEPSYISDDMLRGLEDEIEARKLYSTHYAPVTEVGFITNDEWGFTIGYSPDALVGEDGAIECKSRRQKYQIETMIDAVTTGAIPSDFVLQVQTGLLVSKRKWIDFVSYSGGLPMVTVRVYPDAKVQEAIIEAATAFEARLAERLMLYRAATNSEGARLIPTERRIVQEMYT